MYTCLGIGSLPTPLQAVPIIGGKTGPKADLGTQGLRRDEETKRQRDKETKRQRGKETKRQREEGKR